MQVRKAVTFEQSGDDLSIRTSIQNSVDGRCNEEYTNDFQLPNMDSLKLNDGKDENGFFFNQLKKNLIVFSSPYVIIFKIY